MVRVAGVELPNKPVKYALQYIYGIGLTRAQKICDDLNISDSTRMNQLTDPQVIALRQYIEENYVVEGDLRREVAMNIKSMVDLGTYRGKRHRMRLPVRGQRTHTNARTRKGKSKAIAGKKKA